MRSDQAFPGDDAQKRRQRAEAAIPKRDFPDVSSLPKQKIHKLFHELQVHQIELEMQNQELRRSRQELDAAKTRYFDLYDLAPVGYLTLNQEGLILEANLAGANLLGLTRSALTGKSITQFIQDEDQDIFYLHHNQLFETRDPQTCELHMRIEGGAPMWIRLKANAVFDEDGSPKCFAVMIDINDRKQLNQSLQTHAKDLEKTNLELNQARKAALNIMEDAVLAKQGLELTQFALDHADTILFRLGKDASIKYANPAACQKLGYTNDELVNLSIPDLDPGMTQERWNAHWNEMRKKKALYFEGHHRSKHGETFPVEVHASFIQQDGDEYIFAFINDITERKRAEEQIADMARFPAENSNPVLRISKDGTLLYRNAASACLEGSLAGAKEGDPLPETWYRHVREIFSNGKPHEIEMGNECSFFSVTLVPFPERGYVNIYAKDITELKRQTKALRTNEEKMRTTLTSIGDAVISTDAGGRIELMNPFAETLTGWKQADAAGKPLREVFPIFNEITREPVPSPVDLVLRTGRKVELANHTMLRSREGHEIPIADSGAPIHDTDGRISGVVVVFRDQTKERTARNELAANASRLRRAQQVAQVGDWEFDLIRNTVSASDEAKRIYGLEEEQWSIAGVQKIPLRQYRGMLNRALKKLVHDGKPYDVEFTIKRPSDGALLDIHSVAEYDPGNQVVFGVIQDITSRKQAERALHELNDIQSLILNNSTLGIALILQRKFEWVNPRMCEMIGMSEEQLRGGSTRLFYPNEQQFSRIGKKIYTTLGEGRRFDDKVQFQRQDGTLFWCRLIGTAIDPNKPKDGSLWMLEDITEQEEHQMQLLLLSTAIEHSPETIMITNPDGNIQYVNPAFEATTGYTAEEVLGQNPRLLKSEQHPLSFYSDMWKTIVSGNTWEGRVCNKRKDGTFFTEETTITPVLDEDEQIVNYVAIQRDITQELVKEEELQQAHKMEAVGQLAGGVAHDFNNILQGILGFSELLRFELNQTSQAYDNANEIHKAAKRATKLTQQLLAFSRKQPVQLSEMDLNNVVNDSEALLHMLLGGKHELVLDLSDALPPAYADHSQMTQIIMNLAVNARDAMPNGGRLSISTECVLIDAADAAYIPGARKGRFLCLSVTDTGCGMPAEIKNRIFDPFFTTKEIGSGTGLGLAVIYGIVEQNNGWINVYSEIDKGSCFKIYLPAVNTDELHGESDQSDRQDIRNTRILVVEDDPEIRSMVQEVLGSAAYGVVVASNAEEGLALFDQEEGGFDLLMSDMELPGMRGDELAEILRDKNPTLPVLLFSGYRDQTNRWKHIIKKEYLFLNKPFTVQVLLDAVENLLKD